MKSNTILQRTLGLGSDGDFSNFCLFDQLWIFNNQLTMCSNVWDSFVAEEIIEMESASN